MRLFYSGRSACDLPTFKRLLVIANEISFMDRPAVNFGNWGMVGHPTPFRRFCTDQSPVVITAYQAPGGPVSDLYSRYIQADLHNASFINCYLEGLAQSGAFSSKFIQLEGDYGKVTGREIIDAIVRDTRLQTREFDIDDDDGFLFDVSNHERRVLTLRRLLMEASVYVTSALIVAEKTGNVPVSDDIFYCRLLALRTSSPRYVGETSQFAPFVGMRMVSAVIPDSVLEKISVSDIIEYRSKTVHEYESWSAEINRAASSIEHIDTVDMHDEIARIIASELTPRIIEYKRGMKAVRDKLFGDIVKRVVTWEFPTLSIAYLSHLSIPAAVAAFVAALGPVVPPIVDYFQERAEIKREHAMSYLVDLSQLPPTSD